MNQFHLQCRGTDDMESVVWSQKWSEVLFHPGDLSFEGNDRTLEAEMPFEQFLRIMEYLETFRENMVRARQSRGFASRPGPKCPICGRPMLDSKKRPTACAAGACPNLTP